MNSTRNLGRKGLYNSLFPALIHSFTFSSLHSPLSTVDYAPTTAQRDPNHGEQKFPPFRCVIA